MRRLTVLLMFATTAIAASLPESIERLLASSPVAKTAFWGIKIVEISPEKTLFTSIPTIFSFLRRIRSCFRPLWPSPGSVPNTDLRPASYSNRTDRFA
jgi:hypothetical protein